MLMGMVDIFLTAALLLALGLAARLFIRNARGGRRAARSEQAFELALDALGHGFILLDQDHCIQKLNGKACDLLEQSREAMLKRSIFAFIGQDIVPAPSEANAGTIGARHEFDLALPSGKVRRCRISHNTITDAKGGTAGSILLLKDLSEQERQESYLRRTAAIFEQTAEGVMIMDAKGRVNLINPAFSRITGFGLDEVAGKTPQCFRYGYIWAELMSVGHWQGEIVNHRSDGEAYPEWLTINAARGNDGSIQGYIGLFSDISHMKKTEAALKHMAHYDALTDLPNRTLLGIQLNMALERAARRANKLAIFALDLDGFKTVNDNLGHPAGDLLLQKIASRLKYTLRSEDVVARMGGDEFSMIIENPPSAIHISHLAEKIIAAVAKPVDLQGSNAMVTTSIGIAIFPRDGADATTLLKSADTAMYASKQAGRNTYRYHDDEMAQTARQRMELEQGLRQALDQHQLELYYQPQVDVRSGEVLGLEALLRWNHPERGILLPVEFLPVAEEAGLILQLGEWVLHEACRQAQAWDREQLFSGTISVNVAGQQIKRGDFFNTVKQVLAETGFNPKRLVLEITESVLLRNAKQAMAELGQLHTLGVGIAIDDFGIGYSSLTYLKYLNTQGIKIDQRFVQGLPEDKNDAAITKAILAMGQSLGFNMVAEGVETEAQQAFLSNEGCFLSQGFLYSRPIPAGKLAEWLRAKRLQPHEHANSPGPLDRRVTDDRQEVAGESPLGSVLTHPRWSGGNATKP